MRMFKVKGKKKPMDFKFSASEDPRSCHVCGFKRNAVKLNDMPKQEKEFFEIAMNEIDEFKNNASFVYCVNCAEYSIVSGIPRFYIK